LIKGLNKKVMFAYFILLLLFPIFYITNSSAVPLNRGVGSYTVTTIAGSGMKGLLDGYQDRAQFNWPTGVAIDRKGNFYIADFANNVIRRINSNGEVTTFVGSGHAAFGDGKGRKAHLKGPDNIAIGSDGSLYVADADNFRIRKVVSDGSINTIAGSGIKGYKDGSAKTARFAYPTGVAVDKDDNVYVADRGSHTIRKIMPDGNVSTIAGNGFPGYADGKSNMTHFKEPISVAVDHAGNVYVADSGNNSIRKIMPDGTVTTLAGNQQHGYKDGTGKDALFAWPTGIAVDGAGNIYLCDSQNSRIRRITADGVVSTVAGISIPGFADGPGYSAQFNFPTGIEVDKAGNIYVADSGNNRIRKVSQGGILQATLSVAGANVE